MQVTLFLSEHADVSKIVELFDECSENFDLEEVRGNVLNLTTTKKSIYFMGDLLSDFERIGISKSIFFDTVLDFYVSRY